MKDSEAYYTIVKAIEFITNNPTKIAHFDEISNSCNLTQKQFGRTLKDWCNTDIQHFVNLLNPAANKKLLENSIQTNLFEEPSPHYG